jgi:hypothetical protein
MQAPFPPPYPRAVRELIAISFDFLHMVALFWVFARFANRSLASAFKLTMVWWFVTLAMFYIVMINGQMMPWRVSLLTSIVGLVGTLPAAFLMAWVFRDRPA